MNIAVINETSAGDRNPLILNALKGYGTILNAGMKQSGGNPELTYIETGLLAALVLYTQRADIVIGGCGTGQGFLNSVMQYPGVSCALISEPLDAWLWNRINNGNCISLPLNKGFGWAGEINLQMIFKSIFEGEMGSGYPESRAEPQQKSRELLKSISAKTHMGFGAIIQELDSGVVRRTLTFPGVREILNPDSIEDALLRDVFKKMYYQYEAG